MIDACQKATTLGTYLAALEAQGVVVRTAQVDRTTLIRGATDDSREVCTGSLFVCKGAAFRKEYLVSALNQGAVAYVAEQEYELAESPVHATIVVSNIRRALAVLANVAYNTPSQQVSVCAFTGTKGKTTSVYYLRAMLNAQAELHQMPPCAFITGVEFDDGIEAGASALTTPESFELQRRFAHAAAAGRPYVVMEASSQALKYDRTYGSVFEVGVFTNFGEDHISECEHPTLEDYFESKLRIFAQSRLAVVNLDMPEAPRVLEAAQVCERVVTYSMKDAHADVYAQLVRPVAAGMEVQVVCADRNKTMAFVVPSPVQFNVANALGAVAVAEALGIDARAICQGIEQARVPGRMELYASRDGSILGVVDYAHNGMSLAALLGDLRANYPDRELSVAFGATGGKGKDRRETMGAAAGTWADRIIITEDDPGPENVADISAAIERAARAAMARNAQKAGAALAPDAASEPGEPQPAARAVSSGQQERVCSIHVIPNRVEAIGELVRQAQPPAIVVAAGKGCELTMKRAAGSEPYEGDAAVMLRALAEWDAGHCGL